MALFVIPVVDGVDAAGAVAAVNAAGLSLASGKVYSSVDEDSIHLLGRTQLGYGSDRASFGYRGHNDNNCAVWQDPNFKTIIKSASGQVIGMEPENLAVANWNSNGLTMESGKRIFMVGASTFTTGTGTNSINGNLIMAAGKTIECFSEVKGSYFISKGTTPFIGLKNTSDQQIASFSSTEQGIASIKASNKIYMQPYNVTSGSWESAGLVMAAGKYITEDGKRLRRACAARVWRSGTQSNIYTGTKVIVQFNAEVYDLGNNYTNYRFTAPANGIYHFDKSVMFNSHAWVDGELGQLLIYVNTAQYATLQRWKCQDPVTLLLKLEGSIDIILNAGDYVQIKILHDTGSTLSLYGTIKEYTWFNAHWVMDT